MSKPANPCLFCGKAGNMSRQHVFPDRLKHVIPRTGGERLRGGWHHLMKNGKTVREHRHHKISQGSTGNHRIRKVCIACNTGWLAAMEMECVPLVEELIRGATPVLSKRQQADITKVATSIVMVGEWIQPEAVATTQEERAYFMRKLAPPPNWYVFLGRDGTEEDEPRFLSSGLAPLVKLGVDGPRLYTSFVITMGKLLLTVLATRDDIFFDVDGYGRILGLASLCPPSDWLNVEALPMLSASQIGNIRALTSATMRNIAMSR